jgi:xanthine dehydrogenase YagS FAD-binding subunit
MKSFEYAAPSTLSDATALLGDTWGKTEVLAGGTDLVTCLKEHLTTPDRLVSLKNIRSLKGISKNGDTLRIGATTTLAELAEDTHLKELFPALVTAAEGVSSPQMMSTGTVAGDLCQRPRCWYYRNGYGLFGQQDGASLVREGDNRYHAIFATDGPALFVSPSSLGPVLVALGASIVAEGPGGQSRTIPAAEFFQIPKDPTQRETVLRPNEIVIAVEVPVRGLKNATYEVRHRHGLDWPYVTATVVFRDQGGMLADARVVLGHVAPVPWISRAAGDALNGKRIDEAVAAKCGEAATQGAQPLSRNAYKLQLVKAAVKRAALAAAKA